jgi:hypothetical protein
LPIIQSSGKVKLKFHSFKVTVKILRKLKLKFELEFFLV